MNKDALADTTRRRILNESRKIGISHELLTRRYVFERFLARLAHSALRDRLVLKGAMALVAVTKNFGRATRDMDNPVDLGENELERLGDAQDAFRDLAARMRAFALNEGFAVRLVSWRYDSMAASTALLAVSHTLHSYGADRASAKSKLEEILRFKTVAS